MSQPITVTLGTAAQAGQFLDAICILYDEVFSVPTLSVD
jgi:hypothetical protein